MNAFRTTESGTLDRQYLRVCACYKLLKQNKITIARAEELMKAKGVKDPKALIELWIKSPFAEIERENAPDFYSLPDGFTWATVAKKRREQGTNVNYFPLACAAGVTAWGVPIQKVFVSGMTVRSIHTGKRVRVTGPGREIGTFSGHEIDKEPRFCLTWHSWETSSFEKTQ